ncbi:MAG: histidinol-phosphatase HisJ family protein [Lachnospiraceae bacterium]|nr:histidinol-phosphatase HisJ family protein [Candidatus Equihabitans merdae]
MPLYGDTHLHSSFSTDSDTPPEENIEMAIEKDLAYLCMTDHLDWDYPVEGEFFDFSVPDYFVKMKELKAKYASKIKLLIGVEMGMQSHLGSRYDKLIQDNPFDYVIASQHLVYNKDPWYPETFEGVEERQLYRSYFEETLENLRSFKKYDALGHLDYIFRYGKESRTYHYYEYADVLDEILKLLICRNKALEVNTAGIRKRLGAPNPSAEVLKRYRELGGTLVTLGSDSHKPFSIGYAFEETVALLRQLGFTHVVYYEQHNPRFVKI